MTRWLHPPRVAQHAARDAFDAVAEGARFQLSREQSLQLWEQARAAATGADGDREARARQWFCDQARRIARCPGRETLVEPSPRSQRAPASGPGRQTLDGADAVEAALGFDDYRVVGLREVLQRVDASPALRRDVLVAATAADRAIAWRARRWLERLPDAPSPTPHGRALWHAAERRAVTLYRRALAPGGVDDADPAIAAVLQARGAGTGLPDALCAEMEAELGVSLAGVRLHVDGVAARAALALGAEAFTIGEDVFFAEGAYAPDTAVGRELLAHELTHVAQVVSGRTPQAAGLRVSQPGEPLEQEAEATARRIATPRSTALRPADERGERAIASGASAGSAPVVQRKAKTRAELAARQQQADELDTTQNKLQELVDVYQKYRLYLSMQAGEILGGALGMATGQVVSPIKPPSLHVYAEIDAEVKRRGFASADDFIAHIKRFERSFEQGAAHVVTDMLDRYRERLLQQQQRYSDDKQISALYRRLSGFRRQFATAVKNDEIHKAETEHDDLPGNWRPPSEAARQAAAARDTAVAAGKAEIRNLAGDHPIFDEGDLPTDRRINKPALAMASEAQLGSLMRDHVASRIAAVDQAQTKIDGKHELIYRLPNLMPQFYAQLHIAPDSIFDLIIQDKIRSDAIKKLAIGVALAIVGLALAAVTFGAATPALLAAGAAVAGASLAGYMAYDEYQDYAQQQQLAGAGLVDEPSAVWLVIAVISAGFEAALASRAVAKIVAAARPLKAGPDIAQLAAAVRRLKQAGQIDAKIAGAAEAALQARTGAANATEDIVRLFTRHGAKALGDPELYEAVVRFASAKLREGMHSSVQFMADVKKARLLAKVSGDMSSEDVAAAKRAWEQAKQLERSSGTAVELTTKRGEALGRYSHGNFLEVAEDVELHGGKTIRLDPGRTTTVTGALDDTNEVAKVGAAMPGATVMGENVGGINFLRSPKWGAIKARYQPIADAGDTARYWRLVTDEFWETVNRPWLDEAIARGDRFRFVSDPASDASRFVTARGQFVLDGRGARIKSIFGREIDYLKSRGYKFLADGTAVKAAK